MPKLSTTHCAVENCRTTILNKAPGVSFHPCPKSSEIRNQWLKILKNKCSVLDWARSQICSKHFENRYFDSQRRLKENAIPTLFTLPKSNNKAVPKSKVDRLLSKMTQAQLTANIKENMAKLREPSDLDDCVNDNLECRPNAPSIARFWLMIKKQENLNNRLMDLLSQTNKHVEILQKNTDKVDEVKKDQEQTIDSLKYIVKCLQEKHATLEEQIEILTAVESR